MNVITTMLAAASLLAGCGSVMAPNGPDAQPTEDAPLVFDSTVPDASPPECDVNKPFGSAVEVPGLRDPNANDIHATLTADELTIYFASNRFDHMATNNIYRANRPTREVPFGSPTPVSTLASANGENNPAISADGNTIFFDSYRANVGMVLLMSTRADATAAFPSATSLSTSALVQPSITADGKTLYVSNLENGLLARLQNVGGTFGPPQSVDTQLAYTQLSPATSDDLTLFLTTQGGSLQVTKRTSTTDSWPTPTPVTELHTQNEDTLPSWVSPNGCRLYMTYAPVGTKSRIYMAARPK